jgi:peptidoglycan/xylan/chitin deacetylase (PgdA/CDA1 family)
LDLIQGKQPYLDWSTETLDVLNSMGYRIVSVDIDTLDWEYDPINPNTPIQNYEDGFNAGGSLSLNHDPYSITVNTVVPAIITFLASKGLTCKYRADSICRIYTNFR